MSEDIKLAAQMLVSITAAIWWAAIAFHILPVPPTEFDWWNIPYILTVLVSSLGLGAAVYYWLGRIL